MRYYTWTGAALLMLCSCATTPPASTGDPSFKSLADAQAYYDKLEQQQRKMLANFPSIVRAPCPSEPGLVPEPRPSEQSRLK